MLLQEQKLKQYWNRAGSIPAIAIAGISCFNWGNLI